MGHKVTAVGRYPFQGGMSLVAFTQTPRGTSVRVRTERLEKGEQTKAEFRSAIALAIQKLMPASQDVG